MQNYHNECIYHVMSFPMHHLRRKTTLQQSNALFWTPNYLFFFFFCNCPWIIFFWFFLFLFQLFQIFNKRTVHLCMCRWRVHLPICQDPPGAQADGVRQGHPQTEREPKRQSRHTFRQWRWYPVSPADGYKNTPLKIRKQTRPKTRFTGGEKKIAGTLFSPLLFQP